MIDNYGLWERHEAEQQKQLENLPTCDECGEHIQDEYLYKINGETLCRECMEDKYEFINTAL